MRYTFLAALSAIGLIGLSNQLPAGYMSGCGSDGCCPQPCGTSCFSNCCDPCGCSFDGFYIGANVGWALNDAIWVDRDAWVDNFDSDWALGTVYRARDGVTAGGQIGYNWQCGGCSLVGLEVDGNWVDLKKTYTYSPSAVGATVLTIKDRTNWFCTIRGRAGIVADCLLLYVTGGAAVIGSKHQWSINSPDAEVVNETFHSNRNRWGGVLGMGAEWAFCDMFTFRAEGLYMKFPQHTVSGFSTAGGQQVHFDLIDSLWVARVGLNIQLGRLCGCFCCN